MRDRAGQRTAVVFGAGNVGRGLIGEVFSSAGLEVVFVDVDQSLIDTLNADREYLHVTVDNRHRVESTVGPVRAVRVDDVAAVAAEVAKAEVAATCVGARVLPGLCRAIAPALLARARSDDPPLNLLLAENLHAAASLTKGWLEEAEPELSGALLDTRIGLVSTSIGRMIPAPSDAVAALGAAAIQTEPYGFLPLDPLAVRGPLPDAAALVTDANVPFDFYSDRKLFVHNMGHALCAYLGSLRGDRYVWQAIDDSWVRALVRQAMVASAAALSIRFHQHPGPLLEHVEDLIHRFSNRSLGDTNERVGRDPRRKLMAGDRLLGALRSCEEAGVSGRYLRLAIAAGLQHLIEEEGIDVVEAAEFLLEQGLTAEDLNAIERWLDVLGDGFDPVRLRYELERDFDVPTIP